jgi:hypothetical protein
MTTKLQNNVIHPIRKAHKVGSSFVLTIDPTHVKRLGIDDFTFFQQKPTHNGIILAKYKLSIDEERDGNN